MASEKKTGEYVDLNACEELGFVDLNACEEVFSRMAYLDSTVAHEEYGSIVERLRELGILKTASES